MGALHRRRCALRFAGPLVVGAMIWGGVLGPPAEGDGPRVAFAGSSASASGRTVVTKTLPPPPAAVPGAEERREPVVRGRLPETPATASPAIPAAEGRAPTAEASATPSPPPAAVPAPPSAPLAPEPAAPPAVSAPPPPPVVREPAAPPAPPAQAAVFPAVSAPPERRPFSLLLESLRARENALAAQRSWRKRGLSPYLVQAELGEKGTWWRLLLGAYRSLPEALAARRELGIDAAVPVKTPFGNLVGEFSDPQEAAVLRERLAARGWDPYLLEESGRPLRVFVGAFADTASAEKQRRELGAQGIEARTVPR